MPVPLLTRLVPAQDYNPQSLDVASLPAFLRVLLTTDGTVTKSLEAYFWEAVKVSVKQHELVSLAEPAKHIHRQKGERVLSRRIELLGENSGTLYGWAESLICEELLPNSIRDDLRAQRLGIGELLRECGLETYREVLDIGRREDESGDAWVWRTYRIVMAGHPLILITEQFPQSVFE